MTKGKARKPRKPRGFIIKHRHRVYVSAGTDSGTIWIGFHTFTLAQSKRLHAWLGHAIAYLEARG